jgi:hypothetical protein
VAFYAVLYALVIFAAFKFLEIRALVLSTQVIGSRFSFPHAIKLRLFHRFDDRAFLLEYTGSLKTALGL